MAELMLPEGTGTEALIALRRLLHRHAELAFAEVFTSAVIRMVLEPLARQPGVRLRTGRETLDASQVVCYPDRATRQRAAERAVELGVPRELAATIAQDGTAVVLDIEGNSPGGTLGLRFDFDGLPIMESSDAEHFPASQDFACTQGTMHACGHDGHTAMGLVLSRRLVANRNFTGGVRLIFQPAEESVRGAAAMIAAGVCEGIDDMVGLHLGEGLELGQVAAGSHGLQATVKFEAHFTGVAAHAAGAPQQGRNAIAAAATATLGLLALPRDSRGKTNVNVGKISGGTQSNIVPEHAQLSGEVRSDVQEVCDGLYERVHGVVAGAALQWDVTGELVQYSAAPTLDCDPGLVSEAVAAVQGIEGVTELMLDAEMPASDDLATWARAVQAGGGRATYLVLGASSPAPHHNPRFDIAEAALPIGRAWLEAIVRRHGR